MTKRIIHITDAVPAKNCTYRAMISDCRNHDIHLWRITAGEWIYPHVHPGSDDIWYIVQGHGDYYISAGEKYPVGPGDLAFASPLEVHGIFNSGDEDLLVLSILAPLPVEVGEAPGFDYPADPATLPR